MVQRLHSLLLIFVFPPVPFLFVAGMLAGSPSCVSKSEPRWVQVPYLRAAY